MNENYKLAMLILAKTLSIVEENYFDNLVRAQIEKKLIKNGEKRS